MKSLTMGCFTGGTALAYYLSHRISEDIDIVSSKSLEHRKIIPNITALGAIKLQDENVTALRIARLFPDEYMIKFVLDNVKLEFFKLIERFKRRYWLLQHLIVLKIQS